MVVTTFAFCACSDTNTVTSPKLPDAPALSLGLGVGAFSSRIAPSKCITVRGAIADGSITDLRPCDGSAGQRFTAQSNDEIHITPALCLDALGGKGNDGDAIGIWTCNGGANQKWTLTSASEIRGINSKCVDVYGARTADGTAIILYSCHGGNNQKWDNGATGGGTAPAPVKVASVKVTLAATGLTVGQTTQATATPLDSLGNAVTGRTVSWTSSSAAVATVSTAGVVSALAAGTATITATVDGKAGSVALTVNAPVTGTSISPGQSIQAAVDAAPGGTAFVIKAGVHRMQQVIPKAGDTFAGEPGAILNGARLLSAFIREGSYWVATGQTQDNADRTSGDGICPASAPRCYRPEDLFFDDKPLKHVATLGEVGAGKWYFDYPNDKIYFADDPTGHRVETSVSRYAFAASGNNVTISGLVIEKYANPLQAGVVSPNQTASGWLMQDNEVRLNHGEGLRVNNGARLLRNNIHHQGQQGVGGFGDGALIEGNEIAFNNTLGVNVEWAAGGVKLNGRGGSLLQDLTIRNNRVHDNTGRGLWCDYNCIRTVYEGNTVERNTSWGIQQEIGYAATIRTNTLNGNGGGIFVSTSQDVEVAGNTINGPYAILGLEDARGTGYYGTLVLKNMNVHDNVVTLPAGAGNSQHVGVLQTNGDNGVFSTANNRFTNNRYTLSGVQRPFAWLSAYRTATEWRGYGLDTTGSITP